MADRAVAVRVAVSHAPAAQLRAVRFTWPSAPPFTLAVPDLTVAAGEKLLLVGPSGAGKSTLMSLLCGVVRPDAGSVTVLGSDLGAMRGAARDRFRGEHFGVLFQMFNLLPYASVIDNVVLPLRFAPARRVRAASNGGEAVRLLARLGIDDTTARQGVASRLSVGQQQRIAAARALIGNPEIIVADEPTSALDRESQSSFLDLLFAEVARTHATLVTVSHDPALAPRFDRVVALNSIATVKRG